MALEQYHHLTHNSTKIQVDSAIRDGSGAKIDTTYLKKTESAPNAINATNAVNDGDGNKIDETYLKVSDLLNLVYPVGSIYTSVSSTDPHNIFGGTWEAFGQGNVLIGAGTGTDANNVQRTFVAGETQTGEYNHTLSTNELPSHAHRVSGDTDSSDATHSHTLDFIGTRQANMGAGANCYVRNSQDGNTAFTMQTNSDNANHSHSINLTSGSTGGGQAHNNIQPYVVVYMWKRTA